METVPVLPQDGLIRVEDVAPGDAQTRIWLPRASDERQDELWVNQGAGGLGDALLGLCAVLGLRRLHPKRRIVYRVPDKWAQFVALFDGGYDGLAWHIWDKTLHKPEHMDPRDLQLNDDYFTEMKRKSPLTRIDRYCKNLGYVTPELPKLRREAEGAEYAGAVILAPFASWNNREYPVFAWMTVEQRLRALGHRVIVVGTGEKRKELFDCEWVMDPRPEKLAGMLLNARCVIGNDSGVAHLAGLLGVRTIVLCGITLGSKVYGFYQNTTCLQGVLACDGCYWNAPYADAPCQTLCSSLCSITPDRVVEAFEPTRNGACDDRSHYPLQESLATGPDGRADECEEDQAAAHG